MANPLASSRGASIARALTNSAILETIYETGESFREIFAWIEASGKDPDAGPWIHDCRLAFTAKMNGIRRVITENVGDFADFDFIEAINPFLENGMRVGTQGEEAPGAEFLAGHDH